MIEQRFAQVCQRVSNGANAMNRFTRGISCRACGTLLKDRRSLKRHVQRCRSVRDLPREERKRRCGLFPLTKRSDESH
jgi:hypothetical protein